MRTRRSHIARKPVLLRLITAGILLLLLPRFASAVEAKKPHPPLADLLEQQNTIPRDNIFGEVKLLHAPNLMDVQFSEDGSVLFSQAETIRLWRSDNGAYLGSIAGPTRFRMFAQLNHSRWLVTIDDIEEDFRPGWFYSMPQIIPCLRLWDVHTGKCLAVRRLRIPINLERLWIKSIATSVDSTWVLFEARFNKEIEEKEREELLGHYSNDHCFLAGFRGPNLTPTCHLELNDDLFDCSSLHYNPHNGKLLIYGETSYACLDPDRHKLIWSIDTSTLKLKYHELKGIVQLDQPFQMELTESGKKRSFTPFVLQFESNPQPSQNAPPAKLTPLNWGLIDPLNGQLLPFDSVITNPGPDNLGPGKEMKLKFPGPRDATVMDAWFYDDQDHTIKAIQQNFSSPDTDSPEQEQALSIKEIRDLSRRLAASFEFDDAREGVFIKVWNRASRRLCIITGHMGIELFDLTTGDWITQPTGAVNSLSKLSSGHLAASTDWREISVLDFKAEGTLSRKFRTKVFRNSCVGLSDDASLLLVGTPSGFAGVWDVARHKKIYNLEGGTQRLLLMAANTSHQNIIGLDQNGTSWRWQIPTSSTPTTETQLLRAHAQDKPIPQSGMLPDNKQTPNLISRRLCDLPIDASRSLAFTADVNVQVFTRDEILSTPGLLLVADVPIFPELPEDLELRAGSVVEIQAGQPQQRLTPPAYYQSILTMVRCTADGQFAMFVFNTGQIVIVNLQSGTLDATIYTGNSEIMDVNYHPEQKTLLVASWRGTISAWDSETFLQTHILQLYDARIRHLTSRPAPDGFDLVLGTADTGLIVKAGVFKKSERNPIRPRTHEFPPKLPDPFK